MNIAVDAMGGDYAPQAMVEGVRLAVSSDPGTSTLVLVGDESRLRRLWGPFDPADPVRIVHASETIEMGEIGPLALRRKKRSSLSIAVRLLADGKVDAVVSAANSSAIVAVGKHFVGLLPGLRRPVLAVFLPRPSGQLLLVDAGAHDQVNSVVLAQGAVLADAYLRITSKLPHPRLGLLNIGEEALKGPREIQGAYVLLERIPVHFVGNVEAHRLFDAPIDALICDGFTGNVVLKLLEGVFGLYLQSGNTENGTGCGPVDNVDTTPWRELAERYCYQKVGGVPLLGVLKPIIVTHGRAEPEAVCNAIMQAKNLAAKDIYGWIARLEKERGYLAEVKRQHGSWRLERWKDRRGLGSRLT